MLVTLWWCYVCLIRNVYRKGTQDVIYVTCSSHVKLYRLCTTCLVLTVMFVFVYGVTYEDKLFQERYTCSQVNTHNAKKIIKVWLLSFFWGMFISFIDVTPERYFYKHIHCELLIFLFSILRCVLTKSITSLIRKILLHVLYNVNNLPSETKYTLLKKVRLRSMYTCTCPVL